MSTDGDRAATARRFIQALPHARDLGMDVLEAGDGLAEESRASTFHPPTLEMLADLDVLDALLERGITSTTFQYRDRRTGPIAGVKARLSNDLIQCLLLRRRIAAGSTNCPA